MTDCDGVLSEYDAVPSYLGELEVQCIAEPEMYADWKFRREDEIAAFFGALSFLTEGESLLEQKSSKKSSIITQSPGPDRARIDRSTALFLTLMCCGAVPFLVVGVFVW